MDRSDSISTILKKYMCLKIQNKKEAFNLFTNIKHTSFEVINWLKHE